MQPEVLVRQFLPQVNIVQLATVSENKPYLCTVHYFSDDNLDMYWCSLEDRRHSQEIKRNSQVAGYVLVHENTPEEDYVIGITILGCAEMIEAQKNQTSISAYGDKLKKGADFYQRVANGEVPQKFYRLRPQKVILFDTKNFPDQPRREFIVK